MSIKWDEWEMKYPRFSEYGVFEHMGIGSQNSRFRFESSKYRFEQMQGKDKEKVMEEMRKKRREMSEKYGSYATLIEPDKT